MPEGFWNLSFALLASSWSALASQDWPDHTGGCTGNSSALASRDCVAWRAFYDATGGAYWSMSGVNSRDDPCGRCNDLPEFGMVECSGNRITSLYFYENNLTGTLPTALSNMTGLTYVSLLCNNLHGTIPELSQLQSLDWLDLSQQTPGLTGTIPSSLASLPSLSQMFLYNNQLTGFVPTFRDNFTQFQACGIYQNHFRCPLPKGAHEMCYADCNASKLQ